MLINLQSKQGLVRRYFHGVNSPITVLPSALRWFRRVPVLAEDGSLSRGDGGRPVIYLGSVTGRTVPKQKTYSTCFQDVFVVGRDQIRGSYRVPLSGDERLRAVLELEAPSLPLPILVL